jgi:hypothetical protein
LPTRPARVATPKVKKDRPPARNATSNYQQNLG